MKDKQFEKLMGGRTKKKTDTIITETKKVATTKPSEPKPEEKAKKADPKHGLNGVAGMKDLKAQVRRDFIDIINNKALADAYEIKPTPTTQLT